MKILYAGHLLRQGFEARGCRVVPMPAPRDPSATLAQLVESHAPDADVVFLELFGRTPLPPAVHDCPLPLAAYCVDTPINEFWLAPLLTLFDHVFVDQQTSVGSLKVRGVQARWVPLCAMDTDFRDPAPKEHFLTFVGRTSPERMKRNNILALLKAHFDVHVADGLTRDRMQDLFAASRVVLNENFFPGLNLRVFQALASGSLLLTEAGGVGVDRFFEHRRHLACYTPKTLLPLLESMRDDFGDWQETAARGQEACRAAHRCEHRAADILEHLGAGKGRERALGPGAVLAEARAKCAHAMRFGGALDEALALARLAAGDARADAATAAGAGHLLGAVHARAGRIPKARARLEQGAACGASGNGDKGSGGKGSLWGLQSALKLALLCIIHDGRCGLDRVVACMGALGLDARRFSARFKALQGGEGFEHDLLLLFSDILFAAGAVFEPGFSKPGDEQYPDTAFEYALLAFRSRRTPQALEALMRCLRHSKMEPEALPFIRQAILEGAADDAQIARAAQLAVKHYDFEAARLMAKALRENLTRRTD